MGGWTPGSTNVEGGLHSPFPVKTKLDKVTQIIKCYAHLHRNLYRLEALPAYGQGMVQSSQFKISGLLQPCLVPKPHNHWGSILGLSKPNLSETIRTILQQWEWVTSRFQERLLPYTYTGTVQDISNVMSRVGHTSSKHCLRSVHCTHRAHCSSKGVEPDGHTQEYNNPPVLRGLVGESHIRPGLSPAYIRCSENMPKFRLQFDLMVGRVRPIPDH